ncbi:hypothetical protein [Klebsiella phage 05F01]|nr:hypothetical protein [Klebsiella phage 05F01]
MTNTELLMKALGWQGGTVHQVAQVTKLNVMTILNLHEIKITDTYQLAMYNGGYLWLVNGGSEKNIDKDSLGYPLFWLGVLDAMKQKIPS